MRRHLPSLTALQCFDASARHLSFTKAATELCLTQSAVSRQIKKLEVFLGCALFRRVKQRVLLTEAGESYAWEIGNLLDQAENATQKITLKQMSSIKMAAEPAIAARWLIPRLAEFKKLYPEIVIELTTDIDKVYSETRDFEVAILYGDGQWKGLETQFLMSDELVAVASAKLLKDKGPVSSCADIINLPLLHHSAKLSSSKEWLLQSGYSEADIQKMPGQRFEHFQLLLQAAVQGLGVAILPSYFIDEEIETARLVRACEQTLCCKNSYYVVGPKSKHEHMRIDYFFDWLITQSQS